MVDNIMRQATMCPVCNSRHSIKSKECTGKQNAYQNEYRNPGGRHHKGRPKGAKQIKPLKPIKKNGKEYCVGWNDLRKEVYARDNWHCKECGVHCGGAGQGRPKIQCHHIDYDTTNNEPSNLITLCASCHSKTNFNREDWIEYYKGII